MSKPENHRDKERVLNNIAIFLAKTYRIVDNPAYKEIIEWTPEGNGFIIKNITELTEKVFPKYFKHGNFPSFVRQLNLYGFRKLRSSEQGQIFTHDHFCRDQPERLVMIKRKSNQAPQQTETINDKIGESQEKESELAMIPAISQKNFRETELEGELMMLSEKHESLQNLVSILVEQNKEIIMQNKNFINKISKMDDSYRKRLETLIFLMVFGLKNGDNNVIIPQQLSNMIRAFTSKKKEKRPKNNPQEPQNNAVQLFNKPQEEGRFNNKNIDEILQMLELQSDNEEEKKPIKKMEELNQGMDHPSPIPSLKSFPSHLQREQKDDWNQLLGSIDHSDFYDFQERS